MAERKKRTTSDEWVTEEAEASKPVTPVISVRFDPTLAERLFKVAERRGVATSVVVREAVEDYLTSAGPAAATLDISISSAEGPVTFYAGRSSLGRTASGPSQIDLERSNERLVGTP